LSEERFAEFVGLDDADIITHIRYAQCGIDEKLAGKIHAAFSHYTVDWLLGRPEAKAPEVSGLFPEVEAIDSLIERLFEHTWSEFGLTSARVSKLLIGMIPLSASERSARVDELTVELRQLTNLFGLMRQCVQPATRSRLAGASEVCDALYEAAEEFGVTL
ncbi:MAG: hypothetical protein K2I59_02100, partial [Alistipes sp.]|nr:hypothetical protein [Alistipes sp.]